MFWGKSKNKDKDKDKKKAQTIDLRKKRSIFKAKGKTRPDADEPLKCKVCRKKITGKPLFCNQYVTRSRLCNAGPFCSDECWDEHMRNSNHY